MYLWDSFAEEPNFLSCQMSTSCRLSILFIFLKSYGLSFFVEVRLHCGHFQESYLKVGLSPSKKIFICFIESPLKMMKNVFFHLQSSFRSQDIYVFVTSFWSCRKYGLIKKVRLTSKFLTSQPGLQTIAILILPNISQSKGNQTMKFYQLIEYIKRNIFLQKLSQKWGKETSSRLLFNFWKSLIWGESKWSAA